MLASLDGVSMLTVYERHVKSKVVRMTVECCIEVDNHSILSEVRVVKRLAR